MTAKSKFTISRRTLLAGASGTLIASRAWAQQPSEVKVGLLVPISGLYARPGTVMREGAEMAVDHINAQGGIKALGGAKLKLVVLDSGDTTEKAKNAAQRMVAQETDLVAASGAYLSSFTLAVTEVTERASLPVLTLSYSDLITDRGFKYVFQTAATAGSQARQALPQIIKLAETASGKRPKTVAILTDNTGASIASAKAMREGLLAENQLQLIVDETFTPPLADATSLVQKIRSAKPDLLFFLPTVISDAKLLLEKMNEFGLGQGKIPTISFGIAIAEPDMLQTVSPELLQGVLTCVASWGAKGHEALIAELKDPLQGAVDDAERDLHLWRHVGDQGRAREGRQGRPRCRRRGAAHHGCRPLEILSAGRDQVRREGPPRRRRHDHRAVAIRRAGDGVPAPARAGAAVLAQKLTEN
ncbi:branched-chain amino acid transport system substrate-binding protein [Bradyrhizobium sp. S3.14.4]